MSRNNKRRRRNNEKTKPKKLIRCKALNRPVFDNEVCSKFSSKISSNTLNNCVNCIHAF